MYISFLILRRLIILPVLYMICIVIWWRIFDIYTLFLAVIPLTAFVLCFSYPILNYISLLSCTLLILYIMKIPIKEIYSTFLFWGIQAFLLSVALCISIIRAKIPNRSIIGKKKHNYFINNKEDKVVYINVQLRTINAITYAACKLYGWNQKELVNQPINFIHIGDLWSFPPHEFWQSLDENDNWCGFLDIITKDKVIFEEKAYYKAIKDANGQIIMLEKKIIDFFLKEQPTEQIDMFYQFYEEFPQPMAVINKKFQIESANPEFMKNSLKKPILANSMCTTIFNQKIHSQLLYAINEAFEGNKYQFVDDFYSIRGVYQAEYIFTPYIDSKYNMITHVLLMLKLDELITNDSLEIVQDNRSIRLKDNNILSHNILLEDKSKQKNLLQTKDLLLIDLLQQSITLLYKTHPYSRVKLYGLNIKELKVCFRWESVIKNLLLFMESMDIDQKHIVISCIGNAVDNIIKISFTGMLYTEYYIIRDNIIFNEIQNAISEFGSNLNITQGKNSELNLSFLYK